MPRPPSFLFRLVGVLAGGFVLTVFVMVAALFSDPDLPLNQWLNRYSLHLLMGEVGLLLFVGFLAMVRDQAQTTEPVQDSMNRLPPHPDPLPPSGEGALNPDE